MIMKAMVNSPQRFPGSQRFPGGTMPYDSAWSPCQLDLLRPISTVPKITFSTVRSTAPNTSSRIVHPTLH